MTFNRRSTDRPVSEHWHPEYWTEADHNRFEDRVSAEIRELRAEVHRNGRALQWAAGALAIIVVLVNVILAIRPWEGMP